MSDLQPSNPIGARRFLDVAKEWLPILTVVGGAAWALVTFLGHEREVANEAKLQAISAQESRNFETRRPFLDQQLKYYIEVAKVAGYLVTHKPSDPDWDGNNVRFAQLYWSELSIVESRDVESAMVDFGKKLDLYVRTQTEEAHSELKTASLDLAHAIRADLDSIWKTQ